MRFGALARRRCSARAQARCRGPAITYRSIPLCFAGRFGPQRAIQRQALALPTLRFARYLLQTNRQRCLRKQRLSAGPQVAIVRGVAAGSLSEPDVGEQNPNVVCMRINQLDCFRAITSFQDDEACAFEYANETEADQDLVFDDENGRV